MTLQIRAQGAAAATATHASNLTSTQRYALVMQRLRQTYQERASRLHYETPFQLLIAAILLAQSTEQEVNSATPALFTHYPTPDTLAVANRRALAALLHPIGFARQKAKYLPLTSQIILNDHAGHVPADLLALTRLPGVARKTANFIMAELHGTADGILVDMNVRRVAQRLGLARAKSAEAIENQLMQLAPRTDWIALPRLFDQHAALVCTIHQPACAHCPVRSYCPSATSEG